MWPGLLQVNHLRGSSYNDSGDGTPFYQGKAEFGDISIDKPTKWTTEPKRIAVSGDILMSVRAPVGPVNFTTDMVCIGRGLAAIRPAPDSLSAPYAFYVLRDMESEIIGNAGATFASINKADIANIKIPLPPLEVQRELVAEIEGYQRVIDGARMVVENWRPRIVIDPEWPVAGISELVANTPHSFKAGPFGSSLKKDCYVSSGYKVYGQEQVIRGDANFGDYYIDAEKYRELEKCKVLAGDVLVSLVGTYGKTLIIPDEHEPGIINPRLVKITLDHQKMQPEFLAYLFIQDQIVSQIQSVSHGGTMKILGLQTLKQLRVPVPPVTTQQAIVAEIGAEQALVSANRELVERMEQRIQDTIARVWDS